MLNLNIVSIYEAYKQKSLFDSLDDVLDYLSTEYGLAEDEVAEISEIARIALKEDVDVSKLFRRNSSMKKVLDEQLYSSVLAMFINGAFFGIYLSEYLFGKKKS